MEGSSWVAGTSIATVRRSRLKYQPMKFVFVPTLFLLLVARVSAADKSDQVDSQAAGRFAKLALTCLHQEYPNRIGHTLNSDADVAPPRKLTPAFYGCYDWHSSVHGHWLLVRLIRTFPDGDFVQPAREALRQSLTTENIARKRPTCEGKAAPALSVHTGWLGSFNLGQS